MYFFDQKSDENILKLSFNAIRRPFKLQRSSTEDQFFIFDLNKKNNSKVSNLTGIHQREEAVNFCSDLLTLKSKS